MKANKSRPFLFFVLLLLSQYGQSNNVDTLIFQKIRQADSLRSLDQTEVALQLLLAVRNFEQSHAASCAAQASLFHKIGVCNYVLDRNQVALNYWRDSALVIRLQCFGKFHAETANSYYVVAMAHRYIGNQELEGENMRQALAIIETLPKKDTADVAYKYLQAGSLYDDLGDFGQALIFFAHAQRYYDRLANPDPTEVAELMKLRGLAKNNMGQYRDALQDFIGAINMYQKNDAKRYAADIGHCHQNLSLAYIELGELELAEQHAQQALHLNEGLKNPLEQSKNMESLGRIRKRKGLWEQALAFFQQSLELRLSATEKGLQAHAHENIADVLLAQGKYNQAISTYQVAISLLAPAGQERNKLLPPATGQPLTNRRSLFRLLALQANALRLRFEKNGDRDDLLLAYQFYRSYDTLHIQVRQRFGEASSKYWLMREAKPVFEAAIGMALQLHELTGAHQYLEEAYLFSAKNKAAVLLDGLQELDAKLAGVSAEMVMAERQAKQNYLQVEKAFFELGETADQSSLRSEMFEAKRTYDKLVEQLEQEYPAYYRLKYSMPNLQSISELQAQMPGDAVVLEYFVGEKNVHVFLLGKNSLQRFSTPRPESFAQSCHVFRQLTDGSVPFQNEPFQTTANSLFQVLLKSPLEAMPAKVKRLIIIPDEQLLQLSFDVLPFQEITGPDQQWPYLLRQFAISIAYSNQLIFGENSPENLQKKAGRFGGFGLEYDDHTLESLKKFSESDSLLKKRSGGRLPNSDDEVAEIAKLLHGDAWLNQAATKAAFLANAHQYQVVHLAMHALVDEEQPLNSALIFSQQDTSEDFVLRASEVYGLQLNAEMIVLSACNTANGPTTPEGVRSLSRAFAFSGCPSLVASLWYAYDAPTRKLMEAFYQHLKDGQPKDVALRLAKLEYLDQASPTFALPEYWSNFVIIGQTSPIETRRNFALFCVVGGLGLSLLLTIYFRKRNRVK